MRIVNNDFNKLTWPTEIKKKKKKEVLFSPKNHDKYKTVIWIVKNILLWKESLNSDGQQFQQNQQKRTITSDLKSWFNDISYSEPVFDIVFLRKHTFLHLYMIK
jgi:hypothetical protein